MTQQNTPRLSPFKKGLVGLFATSTILVGSSNFKPDKLKRFQSEENYSLIEKIRYTPNFYDISKATGIGGLVILSVAAAYNILKKPISSNL